MAARLPAIAWQEGLHARVLAPNPLGERHPVRQQSHWLLIGQAGADPFFLHYTQGGATTWQSPAHLGVALRRKILTALREQIRGAPTAPPWLPTHDLTALSMRDGHTAFAALYQDFVDARWQRATLGATPTDWIFLTVPYAEKDLAKAQGAVWDPGARRWKISAEQVDACARWRAAGPHPTPCGSLNP